MGGKVLGRGLDGARSRRTEEGSCSSVELTLAVLAVLAALAARSRRGGGGGRRADVERVSGTGGRGREEEG